MNTLKAIFCCALLAVAGCAGVEPTDDADIESDVTGDESDVASAQEAVEVEDTPDARPVCWGDDGGVVCCGGSGGGICCFIEGNIYCD